MRDAGCDTVIDAHDISVLGLAEVVQHLPHIYGEYRRLLREVDARKPDAAILIDFPDFNLRLARQLHKRGIPVIYYVSPQLWAWRSGRIAQIRKYVRKMLVIFPFEEKWYRERGVEVEYVGHPLADETLPSSTREEFAKRYTVDPEREWIALLPGSRSKEINFNLEAMLRAASTISGSQPATGRSSGSVDSLETIEAVIKMEEAVGSKQSELDTELLRGAITTSEYEYVLPVAPSISAGSVRKVVSDFGAETDVKLVGDVRSALFHSRAAVVASGTATLETALIGTPFVMVYRVSPLSWTVGRPLVKVDRFAMPNLIAGRDVVPELIQSNFTAEKVVAELKKILPEGPDRQRMIDGLAEVRAKLHPQERGITASDRAAEAVLSVVKT